MSRFSVPRYDNPALLTYEDEQPLFIFGDVHGCADELVMLLQKACARLNRDEFRMTMRYPIGLKDGKTVVSLPGNVCWLSLGDAFSKGPDPWGVYQKLTGIKALKVRGNHEHRFLPRLYRLEHGVEDRNRHARRLSEDLHKSQLCALRRWIENAPYVIAGKAQTWMKGKTNWMAVHAGPDIQHGVPLAIRDVRLGLVNSSLKKDWCNLADDDKRPALVEAVTTITEIRYLDPHDRMHWSRSYKLDPLVLYGHNPCTNSRFADLRFSKRGVVHSIGVDTGCAYGGRLSGFWLHEGPDKLISVKANRQYSQVPRSAHGRMR